MKKPWLVGKFFVHKEKFCRIGCFTGGRICSRRFDLSPSKENS